MDQTARPDRKNTGDAGPSTAFSGRQDWTITNGGGVRWRPALIGSMKAIRWNGKDMFDAQRVEMEWGGRPLILETGKIAR
ncbi:MAG: hypothetical protein AAF220_06495, partial [Pseudomonadota bacterium]